MPGLCHCHRHAALRDRPLPLPPRQLHPRRTRAGPRCPRSPGADTKPVLLPPRDPSGIAAAVPGIREQEPLASSSPGLQRLPGAACADTAPSPLQNPGPALLCPTFTARCAQSPPKLTRFTFWEARSENQTSHVSSQSKVEGSRELGVVPAQRLDFSKPRLVTFRGKYRGTKAIPVATITFSILLPPAVWTSSPLPACSGYCCHQHLPWAWKSSHIYRCFGYHQVHSAAASE